MARFIVCFEPAVPGRMEKFENIAFEGLGGDASRRLQEKSWIVACQGGSAIWLYDILAQKIDEGDLLFVAECNDRTPKWSGSYDADLTDWLASNR